MDFSFPQHSRNVSLSGFYLVMQDLNASYKRPCILDMKLGTRTYRMYYSILSHRKAMELPNIR